jgi:hypothetical protein
VIAFTTNKRTEEHRRASPVGQATSFPHFTYIYRDPFEVHGPVKNDAQVTRGAPLERWWPSALAPWLYTSTPDLDTIPRHPDTPTPVSIDTRSDTPTPESVRPVSSHQCQAVSMVSKQNRHSDTRPPRPPPDTPTLDTPDTPTLQASMLTGLT